MGGVLPLAAALRDMGTHLCALPTGEYCPMGLVCLGCTHAQPKQSAAPIFRRMLAAMNERSERRASWRFHGSAMRYDGLKTCRPMSRPRSKRTIGELSRVGGPGVFEHLRDRDLQTKLAPSGRRARAFNRR